MVSTFTWKIGVKDLLEVSKTSILRRLEVPAQLGGSESSRLTNRARCSCNLPSHVAEHHTAFGFPNCPRRRAAGIPHPCPRDRGRPEPLRRTTLETEAREAGRGLWRDPGPIPPWEWRKAGATPLTVYRY